MRNRSFHINPPGSKFGMIVDLGGISPKGDALEVAYNLGRFGRCAAVETEPAVRKYCNRAAHVLAKGFPQWGHEINRTFQKGQKDAGKIQAFIGRGTTMQEAHEYGIYLETLPY